MADPIVVQRDQWGARYSAGRKPMPKGIREINIHHSVTALEGGGKAYDNSLDDPHVLARIIGRVERVLHDRGLAPGYSFTFHPSGVILVGAGGNVGAHTGGRNSVSYGFCLLGNYDIAQPTFAQFASMAWMIQFMRWTGALHSDLDAIKIQGHRATKATACPGANMADKIWAIKDFVKAL